MFSTNNYFTHAQYMHDHLPLVTNNDKLYAWQSQLGINLFSEGNTWLGLDTASQDSLKHIVQYNKAAGYGAGGLASFLGLNPVTWPIPVFDTLTLDSILALVDTNHVAYRKTNNSGTSISNVNSIKAHSFSFFPNPTNGSITTLSSCPGIFTLYSVLGQQIQNYEIKSGQTELTLPINLSSGIYTGSFRTKDGSQSNQVKLIYNK